MLIKQMFLLIAVLNIIPAYALVNEQVITYVMPESADDHRHEYFIQLLDLVIAKSDIQYNTTHLKQSMRMQQGRAIIELTKGDAVDLIWSVTSIAREQQLLPIRVPLLKGLLGYRVLMIKKEHEKKFASINHLEDLKQLVAGQGHDWPDTDILLANQLKVTTSTSYNRLFTMLNAGRFDYFPRGVNEAWQELETHRNYNFTVEKHLILYYPSPIYFFVNKANEKLAKQLASGLKRAIADGSFDRLFYNYPEHKKMFALALLNQRTIIPLHNPLLPKLTPLNNKALWYDLH